MSKKIIIKTVEEFLLRVESGKEILCNNDQGIKFLDRAIKNANWELLTNQIKTGNYYYYKPETVPLSKEEIYDLYLRGAKFIEPNKKTAYSPFGVSLYVPDGFFYDDEDSKWKDYGFFLRAFKFYCLPDGEIKPLTKVVE